MPGTGRDVPFVTRRAGPRTARTPAWPTQRHAGVVLRCGAAAPRPPGAPAVAHAGGPPAPPPRTHRCAGGVPGPGVSWMARPAATAHGRPTRDHHRLRFHLRPPADPAASAAAAAVEQTPPRTDRRVALVTGASSGIGAATARRFAARRLASAAQRTRPAAAGGDRLRHVRALLPADLAAPDGAKMLAEAALRETGRIDLLVAGAGIGWAGPFLTMPHTDIDRVLFLDLNATLHLVREVLPAMVAAGGGRVVLVGSVAARWASARRRCTPPPRPDWPRSPRRSGRSCAAPAWASRWSCPAPWRPPSSPAAPPLPPLPPAPHLARPGRGGRLGRGQRGPRRHLRPVLAHPALPRPRPPPASTAGSSTVSADAVRGPARPGGHCAFPHVRTGYDPADEAPTASTCAGSPPCPHGHLRSDPLDGLVMDVVNGRAAPPRGEYRYALRERPDPNG